MVMVKVRMDPTTDLNNRWCCADIYIRRNNKLDNANLHENAWNGEENNRGTHWAEIHPVRLPSWCIPVYFY